MRLAFGILASFCLALPAAAQSALFSTQSSLQFREPIPANGDADQARSAVLSDAEKACAALEKALNLTCTITNIRFNVNGVPYGFMQQQAAGSNVLAASVDISMMQPNANHQ